MSDQDVKVPDLYRLAFVPGMFRCPECGFVLSKQTMFVASGTIGISEADLDSEQCPNDGTDMVHVTWQEQAETFSQRLGDEMSTHWLHDYVSLQEVGRRIHTKQVSIEAVFKWMKQRGSSVLANWGEDTNLWEVSWITGGERYTGVRAELRDAALESVNKCFATAVRTTEERP